MKFIYIFILILSLNTIAKDDLKVIKLGYIQASKRIDNYTKKFVANLNKLLKEKNYIAETFPLPSTRDLYLSNKGQYHGALTRSNLVDNSDYPNLKMIPTPVALMKYQLNKKKKIKFDSKAKKLRLVCIRDDRLCKGIIGKNFEVIEVNSHKAQALMLKNDRADLVMRVHITGTGLKEELVVPLLKDVELEEFNDPFVVHTYTFVNFKQYPEVYNLISNAYQALQKSN